MNDLHALTFILWNNDVDPFISSVLSERSIGWLLATIRYDNEKKDQLCESHSFRKTNTYTLRHMVYKAKQTSNEHVCAQMHEFRV